MSIGSQWVGQEGAAFERVSMAFESLGYCAPRTDDGGDGAYALNIAAQYTTDLLRHEALAIVNYGLRNSREAIRNRYMSEREIIGRYGEGDA